MTLVVGQVVSNGIRLVADSRSTDPTATSQANLFTGALKLVILHPQLCVGYAGLNDEAIVALQSLQISPQGPFDLAAVNDKLLAASIARSGHVEFVVASLDPSPTLFTIRDGSVFPAIGGRGWIGDLAAYDCFQGEYHSMSMPVLSPEIASDGIIETLRQRHAMQSVINDPSLLTVGDLLINVFSTPKGFTYSISIEAMTDGRQQIPSGVYTTIRFAQGAPTGSFTQTVLVPPDGSGIGALGIYLREAKVGAVFYPVVRSTPFVIRSPSQSGFEAEVLKQLGIPIVGLILS